jgi:hypothetical protein
VTKRFCDICDRPAEDNEKKEARLQFKASPALAVVKAVYRIEGDKSGYGGPPDLCRECKGILINVLLQQLA